MFQAGLEGRDEEHLDARDEVVARLGRHSKELHRDGEDVFSVLFDDGFKQACLVSEVVVHHVDAGVGPRADVAGGAAFVALLREHLRPGRQEALPSRDGVGVSHARGARPSRVP